MTVSRSVFAGLFQFAFITFCSVSGQFDLRSERLKQLQNLHRHEHKTHADQAADTKPAAGSTLHPHKNLAVQIENEKFIYVENGEGKYQRITSWDFFLKLGYEASDIKVIPKKDFSRYTIGPPLLYRPNQLEPVVQRESGGDIFVLLGGERRHISSWDTYTDLGYSDKDLNILTDEEFNIYPLGLPYLRTFSTNIDPVMKSAADPKSFFVFAKGQRHKAPSWKYCESMGYRIDHVNTFAEEEIELFPLGSPLDDFFHTEFLTEVMRSAPFSGFYAGSALDFLKEYGSSFKIFDRFFPLSSHSVPPSSKDSWENQKFCSKDVSAHVSSESAPVSPGHYSTLGVYGDGDGDSSLLEYNNRFRYGSKKMERFMSIFFHKDPFAFPDSEVHFVGLANEMPTEEGDGESSPVGIIKYYCNFTSPVAAVTEVVVLGDIANVMKKHEPDNIVHCPVPLVVRSALAIDSPWVQLDLVQVHEASGSEPERRTVLLRDVRVKRDHPLDLRRFNVSISTMLDSVDDAMVIEWLVYNILLGVEHFYIFDNSRRHVDLGRSPLKPFLDANVVTLIYFPFTPIKAHHWNGIQRTSFQVMLQRFGHLNTFVSFSDVDEFFFPGPRFTQNLSQVDHLLLDILRTLFSPPALVPAVMFDTQEIGCADISNFFGSSSGGRAAVTTTCTLVGMVIEEMVMGHGKMFIQPALVPFLNSPHRINDYWVVWTKSGIDGVFRHFDRFLYEPRDIDGSSGYQHVHNESLKDFTLFLLRSIGVVVV